VLCTGLWTAWHTRPPALCAALGIHRGRRRTNPAAARASLPAVISGPYLAEKTTQSISLHTGRRVYHIRRVLLTTLGSVHLCPQHPAAPLPQTSTSRDPAPDISLAWPLSAMIRLFAAQTRLVIGHREPTDVAGRSGPRVEGPVAGWEIAEAPGDLTIAPLGSEHLFDRPRPAGR